MKKSELITIIKLAVREELKTTLPEILSEYKTQNKKSNVKIEKTEAKIKTKSTNSDKVYSRNEKINEALRATVGGVPQEGQLVSSTMETNKQTDFNGNELNIKDLPESVSNALTRDYSELINAIESKKKGK
jgi:membrane-associated HD superfamily phosphohydrolase